MNFKKLNVFLLISGSAFCSGCATDGLKMPFQESVAARWGHSKSDSETELSPEFREAQKLFKKDPEGTLLAWARWQEDVGEYGEARRKYRELLIAYPDNIEAQLGLARIELSCGRVQQAEEILTAVAGERPTNMPVRLELGRLYTQQENWAKAVAAFEEASAIDPENQVCRYELGVVFARSHRFDQALSHLTYAVGSSAANYNIGYVLHEQGKDSEAAEWFRNALEAHPDSNTAEKSRAMLAQLSPKNSRDRNSIPVYPSANLPERAVAARSKQTMIDQYEPASFETLAIQAAPANRGSTAALASNASTGPNKQEEYSSVSTMLPPVSPQPAQFGMAGSSTQQTIGSETTNPFRTVSHAVIHEPVSQSTPPASSLPQWRGASQSAPTTQVEQENSSPTKWRAR